MIRTIPSYSPPAPPPVTGQFKQDFDNLRQYLVGQLLPYQFNYHANHASAFNSGPQGEGSPIPAASPLLWSAKIHHVTGTATITNIGVPPNLNGQDLTLIADAGFTLQTGGNIAHSKVLSAGDIATLTYSPQTALWYLISIVSSLGDITDQSAWQANTSYLLADSIIDPNGNLQQVTTADTSGATQPTWNVTVGGTTADGAILVWTNRGAPPATPNRYAVRSIDVNHHSMIDLSQGHVNKTLDNVNDGSTFLRVASVNGANQATTASLATAAVTTPILANAAVTTPILAVSAVTTPIVAAGAVTNNGTVTDNGSVTIGTSDTTIGTVTISVDSTSDIVSIVGHAGGSYSGYDFTASQIMTLKLKRGGTTVQTQSVSMTIPGSSNSGSGNFAAAFALYDTGIGGAQTYTITMAKGAAGYTATKTSLMAVAIDHKR